MNTLNLDQKAAQYAQTMVAEGVKAVKMKAAEKVENLVTKALGVLQEQGVYAFMLFLFSRTSSDEKSIAPRLIVPLYKLLGELPTFKDKPASGSFDEKSDVKKVLEFYSDKVCGNLDTLLLVKDLYEQTLIYARYGAKAAKAEGK